MTEHELTHPAAEVARLRWKRGTALLVGGMLLLAGVAVGGSIRLIAVKSDRDVQVEEKQQAQAQATTAQQSQQEYVDRAIALCRGADSAALEKLRAVGLCQLAEQDKSGQQTAMPEVPFGVVLDAVRAYMAANPLKVPTAQDLVPVVRQVISENPPKNGDTPTDEELLDLIRQVYAADPPAPGKDGRDGKDGKDGKDGANGGQGVQGPGPRRVETVTRDGQCILQIEYEGYIDGRPIPVFEIKVAAEMCFVPNPTPTVVPTS
jgi:hypothetical protein